MLYPRLCCVASVRPLGVGALVWNFKEEAAAVGVPG